MPVLPDLRSGLLLHRRAERRNLTRVPRTRKLARRPPHLWCLNNNCARMAEKKVSQLAPFVTSLLPARIDDVIEYDELWTFVQSKTQRVWLWIALCRRTTQVIAYHLGGRTRDDFTALYECVPPSYAGCISHSDGFHAYNSISPYYHTRRKKKSGRTARVEGFNNKLRQRLSRLTRKTCSFSKTLEMHETAIRLFLQEHNEHIKSVGL